jgi:hypothetical protein
MAGLLSGRATPPHCGALPATDDAGLRMKKSEEECEDECVGYSVCGIRGVYGAWCMVHDAR